MNEYDYSWVKIYTNDRNSFSFEEKRLIFKLLEEILSYNYEKINDF